MAKNEMGHLLAVPQKKLPSWNTYFCQLLTVQGAGGIRQTETHTAEPLVPEPSAAEIEIAIRNLKRKIARYLSHSSRTVSSWVGGIMHSEIHKLSMLIWNKEQLPHQWKESIVVTIHKKDNETALIIEAYQCCQLHTTFYLPSFSLG
jgi:hypothetical protein